MKIKAVLLDVGGPILDEDHEYGAWDSYLLRLLAEEGMKVGRERLLRAIAEATERCAPHPRVSALWALARPDVGRFRRLKDALREFQRRHIAEEYVPRLRPGVKGALEGLAERYTLALAGNQPEWIKGYLAEEGILDLFAWRFVSEEMGVSKPDPLFFRMILDSLSIPPEEAAMVGDRLDSDVLPAKLIGRKTVRVLLGPYADQVPISPLHTPDRTIRDLTELPSAL
ncbi:hypothetical protein DRJ24_04205 [Candidatus Acetothermia bacterium]|nr:MAG: hypothetical protein DRJ24_04205 [Candidatus Acetothermia bacterium]